MAALEIAWPGLRRAGVLALWCALVCGALNVFGAEVMPAKPTRHFNDYAGVTSIQVQQELDRKLEAFEKSDSTQVIVAIYPRMQSESDIADYTIRIFENWDIGRKGTNNGAALFVFVSNRQMTIRTGYGLEGAIPDITAKNIIETRIKPHFASGDYNAGTTAGVDAIIQAARGEYQGTGGTVAGQQQRRRSNGWFILFLILFFLIAGSTRRRRGYVYGGSGRRSWGGPIIWTGGGSGWGGGGGFGGGGGGWGGGFSGGGGSTGGGGASGSW
ncbi:MAG: TPM domain-containing protein [Limisphaerales bacterium]